MVKNLVKENKNEILALCKKGVISKIEQKEPLKFVDLCFEDIMRWYPNNWKYLVNKYCTNESGHRCYYANLLAFPGNMSLYMVKKELKKDFGRNVSLAGYRYNPEHYQFADAYNQDDYEENLFRNNDNEEEEKEAARWASVKPIDFEAVESLYECLTNGIQGRLVMIMHLDDIPGIINNAYDCYYKGVTCSASNAAMHAKIREITKLLNDEEFTNWLVTSPTDLMFDKNDYISTYQKVLRQLTGVRDESLDFCRELLANPKDTYIEEIIANDYIESETLYSNEDYDDSDED